MIDRLFCGLVFCYNVLSKIVQNGLPALALLFSRIRRLRIKRDAHRDAVCCWHKLDDTGAVAEDILDQLVWNDLRKHEGPLQDRLNAIAHAFRAPAGVGCIEFLGRFHVAG